MTPGELALGLVSRTAEIILDSAKPDDLDIIADFLKEYGFKSGAYPIRTRLDRMAEGDFKVIVSGIDHRIGGNLPTTIDPERERLSVEDAVAVITKGLSEAVSTEDFDSVLNWGG